jgi:hypothetical protein
MLKSLTLDSIRVQPWQVELLNGITFRLLHGSLDCVGKEDDRVEGRPRPDGYVGELLLSIVVYGWAHRLRSPPGGEYVTKRDISRTLTELTLCHWLRLAWTNADG